MGVCDPPGSAKAFYVKIKKQETDSEQDFENSVVKQSKECQDKHAIFQRPKMHFKDGEPLKWGFRGIKPGSHIDIKVIIGAKYKKDSNNQRDWDLHRLQPLKRVFLSKQHLI